jgi:hypothetical protein
MFSVIVDIKFMYDKDSSTEHSCHKLQSFITMITGITIYMYIVIITEHLHLLEVQPEVL